MSRRNIIKSSSILVVLTTLSRFFGLAREAVKAWALGTSALSDAFSIAFLIPNLLRRLFAEGSIAVAFVPTFKTYLTQEADKKTIRMFLSSVFTIIICMLAITISMLIIFTPEIISTFYSSLSREITAETIFLTRIMFPYLACVSLAAFFQGMLNSNRVFGPSGAAPVLFNIMVISITIFCSPFFENPARAMATGVVTGGVVQAGFQLPYVLKLGYRFSILPLVEAWKNPGARKVLRLIGPTIVGMAAYQINILAGSVIASTAVTGTVSSLTYSNRLLELILGIFAVSLGTVFLTEFTEQSARKEWDRFISHLHFATALACFITIPAAVFAFFHAREIVSMLFQIGSFSARSIELTASAFSFHIPGLMFIALNRILAPAFYARSDTFSPTISGIISVAVNIPLAFILVSPMNGAGIALAASIAAFVNFAILIIMLAKKEGFSSKTVVLPLLRSILLISLASALAYIPFYFFSPLLFDITRTFLIPAASPFIPLYAARFILFGAVLLLTGMLYGLLCSVMMKLFGVPYIDQLFNVIQRRLPWKKKSL